MRFKRLFGAVLLGLACAGMALAADKTVKIGLVLGLSGAGADIGQIRLARPAAQRDGQGAEKCAARTLRMRTSSLAAGTRSRVVTASLFALTGCAALVVAPTPSPVVPGAWSVELAAVSDETRGAADACRRDLGSAEVDALIESALGPNRGLHTASVANRDAIATLERQIGVARQEG